MDPLRTCAETRGFFTRGEALAHGFDDRQISRQVNGRRWLRLRPGSYTFTDLVTAGDEAMARLRGRAVAHKLGGAVALSHTSAALEHGLRVWDADLSQVHVTRLDGGAGRTEAGVVHHEGLVLPVDLHERDGLRLTHPARAALETATLLSTEAGLAVLDSCLQLGLTDRATLQASWALMRSWPGVRDLQIGARLADAGGQSVGESRSRYLFYVQALPAPLLQYVVRDDAGTVLGISDFAWPKHRLLGEFDGRMKYGRYLRPGETPGDAVFREKRREDRLCEQLGWRMVRLVWADLYRPEETADRVRRLLAARP